MGCLSFVESRMGPFALAKCSSITVSQEIAVACAAQCLAGSAPKGRYRVPCLLA